MDLFVEIKSLPDKVKVEYSVERHRDLEKKHNEKMTKLNKRLKKMKKKKK
tara:strand:+ start:392 stop:541 length:150 start_codon:yes stop_codon:yes gene_type:complete